MLGWLGRISVEKCPEVFVRTVKYLPADWVGVMVGPNPDGITDYIAREGLQDRVRAIGAVEDVENSLPGFDALLVPSEREGDCLAAKEAMWLGVPVLMRPTGVASMIPEAVRSINARGPEEIAGIVVEDWKSGDGRLRAEWVQGMARRRWNPGVFASRWRKIVRRTAEGTAKPGIFQVMQARIELCPHRGPRKPGATCGCAAFCDLGKGRDGHVSIRHCQDCKLAEESKMGEEKPNLRPATPEEIEAAYRAEDPAAWDAMTSHGDKAMVEEKMRPLAKVVQDGFGVRFIDPLTGEMAFSVSGDLSEEEIAKIESERGVLRAPTKGEFFDANVRKIVEKYNAEVEDAVRPRLNVEFTMTEKLSDVDSEKAFAEVRRCVEEYNKSRGLPGGNDTFSVSYGGMAGTEISVVDCRPNPVIMEDGSETTHFDVKVTIPSFEISMTNSTEKFDSGLAKAREEMGVEEFNRHAYGTFPIRDPRLRVGFIMGCCYRGGSEIWTRNLAGALDKSRFNVVGVGVGETPHFNREVFGSFPAGIPMLSGNTGCTIVAAKCDVLISWGVEPELLKSMVGEAKCRLILVSHGHFPWDSRVGLDVSGVVAVSQAAWDALPDDVKPIATVIPNGVDPERCVSDMKTRVAVRRQLGIRHNQWMVLSLGRIDKQKRPDVVVDAAKRLQEESPGKYRFVMVGDGLDRDSIMEYAARTYADVLFVAGTDQVAPYLAAADCLLQPSSRESDSLSILEAWIAEVPVISTPVGRFAGRREFQDRAFLFCDAYPSDYRVSRMIMDVFDDDEARLTVVRNAHEYAMRECTAKAMADRWAAYLPAPGPGAGNPGR